MPGNGVKMIDKMIDKMMTEMKSTHMEILMRDFIFHDIAEKAVAIELKLAKNYGYIFPDTPPVRQGVEDRVYQTRIKIYEGWKLEQEEE